MTVFTRAIKTSKWNPLPKAAIKMKNFEKKPAKGGIPANEKRERGIFNLLYQKFNLLNKMKYQLAISQ